MKKLITMLCIFAICGCTTVNHYPFYRERQPYKSQRMTRHQVREAQQGIPRYVRVNGKMYRNTHKVQFFNR